MSRWVCSLAARSLCGVAALCGIAASAQAEGISAQARADNGAWLPFSPPPAAPAGICLVDSGVNANPDTEPVLVGSAALDGGAPGDVSAAGHGTLMAMEASAPVNGWGMIGAAPSAVRIFSLRAESTADVLTFGAYKQAIVECQALAERRPDLDLKVISMSIGFQSAPSAEQLAELKDAATAAHDAGLDLVAAAGNESSPTLSYPAAVPPILSVGAYGSSRLPCPFSNGGSVASVLAPGCDLTEASPSTGAPLSEYAGTSQATAIVAGVLGALRAYDPALDAGTAEELLTGSAHAAGGLDVEALFRAAGLGYVIQEGQSQVAEPSSPPTTGVRAPVERWSPRRLPRPRVKLGHRNKRWVVRFLNRPPGARAMVRVSRRSHGHGTARLLVAHKKTVSFRMAGPMTLNIAYRGGASDRTSMSCTIRVP
jgi:hypothetical protein